MAEPVTTTPIRDKYQRMQQGYYEDGEQGDVGNEGTASYGTRLAWDAAKTNFRDHGTTFTEKALNDAELAKVRQAVAMHMGQYGTSSGTVNGYAADKALAGVTGDANSGGGSASTQLGALTGNENSILPTILGSYGYETDEDGNVWVSDTFDFGGNGTTKNNTLARQLMGKLAPEGENGGPNKAAPRSVLNLGKIDDLLNQMADQTDWNGKVMKESGDGAKYHVMKGQQAFDPNK